MSKLNNRRPAPAPRPESSDPSALYGRRFPKEVRDMVFDRAKELEVIGDNPRRDDFVGTEYYVLRTVEVISAALIANAEAAKRSGTGHNTAFAPVWDFKDAVWNGSFLPRPERQEATQPSKPAPADRPAAPAADDKPLGTLADTRGGDKLADLRDQLPPAAEIDAEDAEALGRRAPRRSRANGAAEAEAPC